MRLQYLLFCLLAMLERCEKYACDKNATNVVGTYSVTIRLCMLPQFDKRCEETTFESRIVDLNEKNAFRIRDNRTFLNRVKLSNIFYRTINVRDCLSYTQLGNDKLNTRVLFLNAPPRNHQFKKEFTHVQYL